MYFQTNVRKHQKSSMGLVVSVVLVCAGVLGTVFYFWIKRGEEIQALQAHAEAAIAAGTMQKLEAGIKKLNESEYTAAVPELTHYKTMMSWMLWVDYGTSPAGGALNPASLDSVTPTSELPLVVARIHRDIMLGDVMAAEDFLESARKEHSKEPVLANLYARLALERGKSDPSQLDEANARYFKAMDLYQTDPEGAIRISKAEILFGYALTTELMGNIQGASNNYSAALTSEPNYVWAVVRGELTKMQPEMTFEDADKAIKTMIDDNDAILSPLQRSAMHIERAKWALKTFNLDLAIERLREAARMDTQNVEPLIRLARMHAMMGKHKLAMERLDAAEKIAPKDLRITCVRVMAHLSAGQLDDARKVLGTIPKASQGLLPAQLATMRVQRAANELEAAASTLKTAQENNAKAFPVKVEDAMLQVAKKDETARASVEALLSEARKAGHLAMAPILQATIATLNTGKDRAQLFEQAMGVAEANENATALVILAQSLIEEGKAADAKPYLEAAKKLGDLPQIDEMLKKTEG